MGMNVFVLGLSAVSAITLGLVAYVRGADRPANRLFAFHGVSIFVWVCATIAIQLSTDLALTSYLLRLVHLVSAFVLVTFVDFVAHFPDHLRYRPGLPRLTLYASAALFGSIAAQPELIRVLELHPQGPRVSFGWPLVVFALWAVPLVVWANMEIWRKLRTLHGVARIQTIYMLVGTMAGEATILTTNVILPILTGDAAHSSWGAVGSLWSFGGITLAIVQHRLWDLSSMARRAAAALISGISMTLVAVVAIRALSPLMDASAVRDSQAAAVWTILGGLLGLALAPLYHAARGLLTRRLWEDDRRLGELVSSLGAAIVHAPAHDAVLRPILERTQRFFGASHISAYLRSPDGRYVGVGCCDGERGVRSPDGRIACTVQPPLTPEVAEQLELDSLDGTLDGTELARFARVSEASSKLAAMDAIRASIVVPITWEETVVGVLVVGPKLSTDVYGAVEIPVLESVAAHAAIAVKNAELRDQIVSEKDRTEKVLAQMESGVVATDASQAIRLVNPAACTLLDMTPRELQDQPLSALPSSLAEPLRRALTDGITVSGVRVLLDYVTRLRLECSTFTLRGAGGRIEGAGLLFRDLRMEDALHRVERETERLRFLRMVSAGLAHEIRNPLVAIRTFVELLPSRLDDLEFRSSFLEVATSEVQRLEELVSQFMTLARPAATVRERVDIGRLVDKCVTAISAHAHAHRVGVSRVLAPELPELRGDDARLYQALMNLLLNAVDATPPGGRVELRAEPSDPRAPSRGVSLTVWNSGSYIPPEIRERVFEPFYTGKAQGTGLGLAICHTIVDEHGGTTTVESDEADGTAFVVRLPVTSYHELAASQTP